MVEHMQYIKNLAGIDAIALGSDFDGFGEPCELSGAEKCSSLPQRWNNRVFLLRNRKGIFLKCFKSISVCAVLRKLKYHKM